MNLVYKKFYEFSKLQESVEIKREELKSYIMKNTKDKAIHTFLDLYKYEVDFFADFNTLSFVKEFTKSEYHKIELGKPAPKELLKNSNRKDDYYEIGFTTNHFNNNIDCVILTKFRLRITVNNQNIVTNIDKIITEKNLD